MDGICPTPLPARHSLPDPSSPPLIPQTASRFGLPSSPLCRTSLPSDSSPVPAPFRTSPLLHSPIISLISIPLTAWKKGAPSSPHQPSSSPRGPSIFYLNVATPIILPGFCLHICPRFYSTHNPFQPVFHHPHISHAFCSLPNSRYITPPSHTHFFTSFLQRALPEHPHQQQFRDSPGPEPLLPAHPRRSRPSTCSRHPCPVTGGPSWPLVLFQSQVSSRSPPQLLDPAARPGLRGPAPASP